MNDTFGRPLRNLRLSVTDRCNLRCEYCMPEDDYVWLPREDVLHFEETSALVDVFLSLGVDKVRLTGGEPLLRRDVPALVRMLAAKPGLRDLALTTNGVLLADQIDALHGAGLGRITVSLDTLRRDRFLKLTRFDQLDAVREGIAAAHRVFGQLKIDTVVIRGVNDDELVDLIEYGRSVNGEVRFIEYMDVGGASRWSPARVVSRQEMLETLTRDATARSRRSRNPAPPRLPNGSFSTTARPSASSRRPPIRSARRAIGAGSPPTACGICVSTRRAASTCARRCGKVASARRAPGPHRRRLAASRRPRRGRPPGARRPPCLRAGAGSTEEGSTFGDAYARGIGGLPIQLLLPILFRAPTALSSPTPPA